MFPACGATPSYHRIVEGQAFFTTIAGLAISLAGFGSVIAWLRDDPSGWDPVNLWRVKTIVRHALTISFLCLALVPIFTLTGDETMTIRIGSGLVATFALSDMWRFRRAEPDVWDPVSWRVFMVSNTVISIAAMANVGLASLGGLQILMLVILTSPAGIFYNFVREMGRPGSATSKEPEAGS